MLYTRFTSASDSYVKWLNTQTYRLYKVKGVIKRVNGSRALDLEFAKHESIKLLKILYYKEGLVCLKRKYSKYLYSLAIIGKLNNIYALENKVIV